MTRVVRCYAPSWGLLVLVLLAVSCSGGDRRTIQNKGSDTLVNVANAWAEAYAEVDPELRIAVSGGGSGVGISSILNGTVDIANSSRKMKDKELEQAKSKGIDPKEHVVGFDALAVYVHKDNPIESITIEQLAAIYGEGGDVTNWSQLGVEMPADRDEIIRISRQNNSGTYAYFREAVLGAGKDYKLGSRDMHGSKDVVDTVEHTVNAIGYSGLAYATEHVRMVPVVKDGGAPVGPTVETALDGSYPIARPLLMYTAGAPEGDVKTYLEWILSDAGQRVIQDMGYAPVRKLD